MKSFQAQVGIAIRKYRIFMCMLPKEERTYPLQIVVIATAKVLEFIGLICYKYASEHPNHSLKYANYTIYYKFYSFTTIAICLFFL